VAANSGRTSDWVRSGLSSFLPFDVQRGGYKLVMVDVNSKDLAELGELVKQGKVKATIQREVAFNEEAIREAIDLLKSHRTVGKILVKFPTN
jgi:NADPH:quinone reductase-like Zn-dependent oxidoreductase